MLGFERVLVLVFVLVIVRVLVLVLVVGFERVVDRVTRFRTGCAAIASADEPGQQSIEPACARPCGTTSDGIAFAGGERDVDRGRGLTALAPRDREDTPPISVAQAPYSFSDIEAHALGSAGHLIAQPDIRNSEVANFSEELDRNLVRNQPLVWQP